MSTIIPYLGGSYKFSLGLDDVVIGDPQNSEFKPTLELTRWNKEARLKLIFDDGELVSKNVVLEDDKVKFSTSLLDIHYYPINPAEQYEDGGVELEIILKQKPLINTIDLPVEAENLVWHYQPPLTEEYAEEGCSVWTETRIVTKQGEEAFRPENVVGSYVIYHNSKRNNEYKTGKVFHLYRCQLADVKGNKAWAEYNRDTQKTRRLIITLPQDFLDKAVYPVTIDPTFGYNTIGGSYFTANTRVLVDGVPLIAGGKLLNGHSYTREILVYLLSGSYTFGFQSCVVYSTGVARINNIKIGVCNFPDKQRNNWDSGSVSCPDEQTTTVLDQNFTTSVSRKTAIGNIAKYVCIITVYASATKRYSYIRNPGEADAFFCWKIFIDDEQKEWTERRDDFQVGYGGNIFYGQGAHGKLVIVLSPGIEYNLKIKMTNTYENTNGNAWVDVLLCPWILANTDYEPVSIETPQGSTISVMLEPLNQNPTKYVRVGDKRFFAFGEADYYKSENGTNILSFEYTFERVEIGNAVLHVKGYGGCLSAMAVDIR